MSFSETLIWILVIAIILVAADAIRRIISDRRGQLRMKIDPRFRDLPEDTSDDHNPEVIGSARVRRPVNPEQMSFDDITPPLVMEAEEDNKPESQKVEVPSQEDSAATTAPETPTQVSPNEPLTPEKVAGANKETDTTAQIDSNDSDNPGTVTDGHAADRTTHNEPTGQAENEPSDTAQDGETIAPAADTPDTSQPETETPSAEIQQPDAQTKPAKKKTAKRSPSTRRAKTEKKSEKTPEPILDVVVVHLFFRENVAGKALLHSLLQQGLRFGEMKIFHCHQDEDLLFSVANAHEPGYFNINKMESDNFKAVSLFVKLPGPESPLTALNRMLNCARQMAEELSGTMRDQDNNPLTGQMMEHMRERVQEFERRMQVPNAN